MAKAKKIRVKRILAAVGGVLSLCAAAALVLVWRSMSYDIEAATVAGEETFTLRFDDFSMELPKNFTPEALSFSLIGPEAEFVVREMWQPDPELALQEFEARKAAWAEESGELADISEEMGCPAVMFSHMRAFEASDRFVLTAALVRENIILVFSKGLPETTADLEPWRAALKRRARDFAQSYTPNALSAGSAFTPEPAGSKLTARFGAVEPGPREGYIFSVHFAAFVRGDSTFYLDVMDSGRLYLWSPNVKGKFSRFFLNLSASGYINGIGFKELALDSRPGYETLVKYPYLGKTAALEFHWQENHNGLHRKWLTLTCKGGDAADPPARYGEWKQILQNVRFAKQ